MPVDVILEDDRWHEADLPGLADKAALAVLSHLAMPHEAFEIAVLGCDDARIAALNAQFRDKATPTNVLSWPSWDLAAEKEGDRPEPILPHGDAPEPLGDIAISFDTCAREAEAAQKPFGDHVTHLVVHGVLHLLGYDHVRDGDATLMEGLEREILGKMGLPDPY